MAGPQNAIMGDDNFGIDLPQTQVPEEDLNLEKNMAKFSQSKEFQALKTHVEGRILFYQTFLPDGRPVTEATDLSASEKGNMWVAANVIIGEFNALLGAYEQAEAVLKEAAKKEP